MVRTRGGSRLPPRLGLALSLLRVPVDAAFDGDFFAAQGAAALAIGEAGLFAAKGSVAAVEFQEEHGLIGGHGGERLVGSGVSPEGVCAAFTQGLLGLFLEGHFQSVEAQR
jgi:hypothetical protein